MTRVAVIGPGALGCYFAAKLEQAGNTVSLVDYRSDRICLLNRQGIRVETPQGLCVAHPNVINILPEGMDLILVLTKSYATPSLHFPDDAPVLTLQNGLGNAECIAAAIGPDRVLAGMTTEAVTWLGPGHVRHAASGKTVFGAWRACNVLPALKILAGAGFDVQETRCPQQTLWEKAVLSAGINPLTAILNVPNGVLLASCETKALMRNLVTEAVQAATAEGCCFLRDMPGEAEALCECTRHNISSMLQDIRNKKRTENDAISGEIVRRAHATQTPVPQTQVIFQLVRALEVR